MENTILPQAESPLDDDSLLLVSSIFLGANQIVRDVHLIVAALLRYAMIGASVTNHLMDLMVNTVAEEY